MELNVKSDGKEMEIKVSGNAKFLKNALMFVTMAVAEILLKEEGLSFDKVVDEISDIASSALTLVQGGVIVEEKTEG